MTRRRVFAKMGALLAASTMLLTTVAPVSAATTSLGTGSGMRVSPVRTDLVMKPGQSHTVDVYVTNVTAQTATLQVVFNDFTARDETGNPALILDNTPSNLQHSLRQFVSPINNVTLKAGEQKDVKVVISLPTNTTPGGYYGAVRFAPASANASKNVSLTASVASLILVRVSGNIKEQMNIESMDVYQGSKSHSIFSNNKNLTVAVRFHNLGDVQEQPFGKVDIKNMRGKVVYSAEINKDPAPGVVLPETIRKFTVPIKNVSSFGRYTVMGDFGYGNGQELTGSTTFYVLPVWFVVTLVVVIIAIIVAVVEVPRAIKRYNQRVLRKAGRG